MAKMETELTIQQKKVSNWQLYLSLPVLSWALYDFANTIFSSNINTIFFPFYVKEVVGNSEQLDQIASTFISYANAIASFFLVLFTPLYGTTIDRTGKRKNWIISFTLICVLATILMGVFGYLSFSGTILGMPAYLFWIIVMFVIAKFCYNSSLVFYDSMISSLGTKEQIPLLSGFGVAVGYIGTLVGLTVYLFVGNSGFHQAFIPSALLFLLFSLPLFLFVKEKRTKPNKKTNFFSGYKDIFQTFKEAKKYKAIFTFMIAYFFLNDAVSTTIAMMSVYASIIVKFTAGEFILLYLVSTVSSIIGSFIFGYITKATGPKKAVLYVGLLMTIALVIGASAFAKWHFWIAGSIFGISLGAMWVTSRTFIVHLSPKEKQGQFFGLFAFSGKVSSIIGPAIYGSITLIFNDYGNLASRLALSSLIIMTIIGVLFLLKVNPEEEISQS